MFANISGESTHVRTWQSHSSLQDTGVHGGGDEQQDHRETGGEPGGGGEYQASSRAGAVIVPELNIK